MGVGDRISSIKYCIFRRSGHKKRSEAPLITSVSSGLLRIAPCPRGGYNRGGSNFGSARSSSAFVVYSWFFKGVPPMKFPLVGVQAFSPFVARLSFVRFAVVAAVCFSVGVASVARAAITVTGSVSPSDPASWTSSTISYIGSAADGSVTADDGSDLLSKTAYLGYTSGVSGVVTVNGTGATWTNSSGLNIGYSGTGRLNITAGGSVGSAFSNIGYNSGSYGLVTVSGSGSQWNSLSELLIGWNGKGELSILDGGYVSNAYCCVGDRSYGSVAVSGTGSQWNTTGFLSIGFGGTGMLSIADGGVVNSSVSPNIGYGSSSVGIVTVRGTGAAWTSRASLYSGYSGTGTLNVTSGGSVGNTYGYIGYNSGSVGTATVSGTGSKWTNSSELFVGSSGTGTLNIADGGAVQCANGYVGYLSGSVGTATVSGTGSTWTNSDYLYVGYSGTGTLNVTSGGSVGNSYGYIGYNGDGSVTIDGGSAFSGYWLAIGYGSGATGSLILNGGKLELANSAWLGRTGTGAVTQSSGTAVIKGDLYLGYNSSSSAAYKLSGGQLTVSTREYIGFMGKGVFVQTGGTNSVGTLHVGSAGLYTLNDGQLSSVSASVSNFVQNGGTNFITGSSYSNMLSVVGTYTLNGGRVSATYGESVSGRFIQTGGTNEAGKSLSVVYGTYFLNGGQLSSLAYEYIGNAGTGVFTQTGGTNSVSTALFLAYLYRSAGTYNLDGGTLVASSEYLGHVEAGTFDLYGGTAVFAQTEGTNSTSYLEIGAYSQYVLSGGSLTATSEYLDYFAPGTYGVATGGSGTFIQTGGTNVTSSLQLNTNCNYLLNGGSLVVSSIASKTPNGVNFSFGGGILRAAGNMTVSIPMTLTGTNGNANIDTNGYAVTLSGTLSGEGGLTKLGSGTLALVGSNSFTGGVDVVAGTLIAKGAAVDGGTTAALALVGDLTLEEGAKLAFELGATSSSDKISMADSTLHVGTLEFSDFTFSTLAGFGAGTYTLIDAFAVDGVLGANTDGMIGGLCGTLAITGGDVVLNVSAVPEPTTMLLVIASCGFAFAARRRR